MSHQTASQLTALIERAGKVLHYEPRGNHQDKVVTGGLDLFVVNWAEEASALCKDAGLDVTPVYGFTERLEGYPPQEPMQRAVSLRTALSILNELENNGPAPIPHVSQVESKGASQATQPAIAKQAPSAPPVKLEPKTAVHAVQRESNNPIHLDAGMTSNHASLTLLSADVTVVPGIGPSAAARLRSLGVRSVRDLLFYFPRQHRDYSKLTKIASIPFGEVTTTLGLIWEVETTRTSGGRPRTIATISDDTAKISASRVNPPYVAKD